MPEWSQTEPQDKVSIYGCGKVTPEAFGHGVALIKKAFPKLSASWYSVLETMIDEEGFTDDRFKDAVLNLIKTCPYPEPTIANILGFNKEVPVFTRHELQKIHGAAYYPGAKYDPIASEYECVEINGQKRFVCKENFNPVRFKKWEYKK